MALTGAITVAITYVSPVAHLFSFSPPSVTDVGLVLLGAIIYFFALDVLKVRYYSLTDRGHQAPRAVVPAPEKRAAPPGA
jgi:hypothetical protein